MAIAMTVFRFSSDCVVRTIVLVSVGTAAVLKAQTAVTRQVNVARKVYVAVIWAAASMMGLWYTTVKKTQQHKGQKHKANSLEWHDSFCYMHCVFPTQFYNL